MTAGQGHQPTPKNENRLHGAGLLAAVLPEKNKGQYTLMPVHEPAARAT